MHVHQGHGPVLHVLRVQVVLLGKLNSNSLYVKFLAIDLFTLLYRRSSRGLKPFTETIVNSVYNRHHLVMLKVLSVFVSLLEDKENVLPKETAEDIIVAIVGFTFARQL